MAKYFNFLKNFHLKAGEILSGIGRAKPKPNKSELIDWKITLSNENIAIKRMISFAVLGTVGVAFYQFERVNFDYLRTYIPILLTCRLESQKESVFPKPPLRADLPIYSIKEVGEHGKSAKRIWVVFEQGVYDITDFVAMHPGGDKILMAAGSSVEPFWEIYAQHKTEEVLEMLEELRIGTLNAEDIQALEIRKNAEDSANNPYSNDPIRHPALVINMQKPFNAETPPSLLVDSFLTPNQLFFVRNHMPVPKVNEREHQITIDGVGIDQPIRLSMEDLLTKFEPVVITSTIQCAGNRRNDMNEFKKVQGLMWTGTAISTARWKGCRLKDVLINAGIKPNADGIKHVHFEGADVDLAAAHYGASITFEKAMSPEVILAFEMNDEPLTKVRIIAPGIVGARQVKWLKRIRLSAEESPTTWQRRDYKAFPLSVQIGDSPPFDSTPSIQEYPVQSAICVPSPNAKFAPGTKTISVSGYAWSGGGRGIIRVEVSADGGKTWQSAELEQSPGQDLEHMWAWTLWRVELTVPEEMTAKGKLELTCKATDRAYNTQPETPAGLWNVRGLLHNAWHRVPVAIE